MSRSEGAECYCGDCGETLDVNSEMWRYDVRKVRIQGWAHQHSDGSWHKGLMLTKKEARIRFGRKK